MSDQPAAPAGRAFSFRNWKSFADARLPLAPLTVLIGANASGKSNAIEGIRLLSMLAQGNKLHQILADMDGNNSPLRGGRDNLAYHGHSQFTLGYDRGNVDWRRLELTLARQNGGLHLVQERVLDTEQMLPLYKVSDLASGIGPGREEQLQVKYLSAPDQWAPEAVTCSDQRALFVQLDGPADLPVGQAWARQTIPAVTTDLWYQLSRIVFLDASASAMRGYAQPTNRLQPDGSNVSGVLERLCSAQTEIPARAAERNRVAVLGFVQSLPEQHIVDIGFVREPLGKVLVELTETFGGVERKVNATVLSDGTLRVLAIAAAILTAAAGSMVVVEEIDNGVHPSRVGHLMTHIRTLALHHGVHVLVTTHNPALLDALPSEAVPDVVVCYRDPQDGTSKLSRLEDLPDYVALTARGTVGEAMTSGALERATHAPTSPEQRRDRALAWLAQRNKPEAP